MVTLLENNLQTLDLKLYNRFKLIKKILYYTADHHQFTIPKEYFIKILSSYFNRNFKQYPVENFLDELYNFLEDMIELYLKNSFSKYNFILETYHMTPFLKDWLKPEKENILKFFNFYLDKNSSFLLKETILKNNYFEIVRVTSEENGKWIVPYIEPDCILIRFMIQGKIYYNNGILLENRFYFISDNNSLLESAKFLSDKIDLLIVILKKEFLEDFNILTPVVPVVIRSSNQTKKIFELLEVNFIQKNPFAFLEILSYFLKSNRLLKEEILPFSENLIETNNYVMITSNIEKNIKLPFEEINSELEKSLQLSTTRINSILLQNTDFSLKKTITRLKIKHIIEEFYSNHLTIEELLVKYNFSNIKQFRYNLKIFFKISIKDLKNLKKSNEKNS